ncbi:MAG TPA: carboxypeptidase regulatory-like domain-containing protein [Candidatus Angelobacter sp.]
MKTSSLLLWLFLCLLASAISLSAQTSLGSITGDIMDPQQAVITDATVTVTSNLTGEKHTTTSNAQGAYRFEALPPGTYNLQVEAPGFATAKLENITVAGSQSTTLNVNLKIGPTETSVIVETSAQQIHTDDGAITHNISNVEIASLPISNLNPISLVLTLPGVVAPTSREDFTNGVGFSVNGTRPRANNFLIEGQDNNDNAIQGQALQVINLEATKEVDFLENSYSAEYGHGGGSVTNIIYKSGTNAWHGSAFDLLQNSTLNSNNASDKINGTPKAKFRENTFGFTLGGPVHKDKIFVFGSIQWDKTREGANGSNLTVPTDAGFAVLQSLSAGNPRLTNYLSALGSVRGNSDPSAPGHNLIPLSGGRPSVEVGRVQRNVGEPSNDTQYVAKGDWLPTSNDTVTLRYVLDRGDLTPDLFNFPNLLPCCDTQQGGSAHNAGINYTHTFSPHLLNEFRASYGRIGFSFLQTPATAANPVANGPTISISQVTGFGTPSSIPQGRFHNTFQYQDTVTWSKGNHTFKFGADLARILVRDGIPFNSRGTLSYGGAGSQPGGASGLSNFIDDFGGSNGSAALAFGSPILRPTYLFQNYFAEDTWRLRPNFTLSLGVRYENDGTPANSLPFPAINAALGAADPNFFTTPVQQIGDNNNWAPRVSFAYTPRFWQGLFGQDKTVIRAGYGIYYDNLFTNIVDNSGASSPNAVSKSATSVTTIADPRGIAGLSTLFGTFTPVPSQNVAVTSMINNLVAPMTHQWNFDIERQLPGSFVVTTSYVGTRGERLFVNDQFNPIDPNTGLRVVPTRNSWTIRDNAGDSIYHAFELKLDRRFTRGLLLRTSYTFSKLIDNGSEVFTTTGASSFPADLALGHRGIDRGLSAFDHRNRVVLAYVYNIPKFKNDSNFGKGLGYVVNGWQIAGTTAYQSGAPSTISDGFDNNGDGQSSDRPSIANPAAPITAWAFDNGAGGFCDGPTLLAKGACTPFLNGTLTNNSTSGTLITAANIHWLVPFSGFGNLGRNTFVSPGRQDWTFALQRTIPLHSERHQLVLRMEMLNPFNHPNTGNPASTNLSAIGFFCASAGGPLCNPTSPIKPDVTFMNIAETVDGERDIRFWLKYQF